jgi:hypothetical protein
MVPSLKLSFVANDNYPTGIGLASGNTIHFRSLVFTADHLGRLSLTLQEWDSGTIFVGMVHNRSPSLSTVLKESSNEDITTSGAGGNFESSGP